MKKILLFAFTLAITSQLVGQRPGGPPAGGQRPDGATPQPSAVNKEAQAAIKAYEKTKTDISGKKAQDAASWVKLGKNLITVFEHPSKNIWVGISSAESRVLLKDMRPTGSETKTINGDEYNIVHYSDKDLYYNADGILSFWVVTKPLLSLNLLDEAYNAFQKGYELDAKGSQKKDLEDGLTKVKNHYLTEAMSSNMLGDFSLSSKNFGLAVRCMEHPVINEIDTLIVFYTGYTAFYAQEYERARTYIQRAINMGFTQEGTAYSFLAECYKNLGETDKIQSILAEGFTKYPSNQAILVTLINMYMENDEDPMKIMEFIKKAQENEPDNASLFVAEGNVWRKLNNNEKAIESFEKSIIINPDYILGYYTIGQIYYEIAIEIQNEAADELDDNKWSALIAEMDQLLLKAIDPFEKCFSMSDDYPDIHMDVALFLKTIYYRMQGKDEAYAPLYEKYRDISEGR